MASSSTFDSGIIIPRSPQYPYPSHVNAASFISIKLSGKANYSRWQAQVMCIVESHDMLGFIDGTLNNPKNGDRSEGEDIEAKYREWKRSDTLMKGWLLGSLCEDVMDTVIGSHTANDVWRKLKYDFSTRVAAPAIITTSTRKLKTTKWAEYLPLYKAILSGDWEKANDIFTKDKDALTVKLNDDNHSPLHVAIGTCENIEFLKNLLKVIDPSSLPTLVTSKSMNPLHYAAFVGNTEAAELLVAKNKDLLFHKDSEKCFPIHEAIFGSHIDTFRYLLMVTKYNIKLCNKAGCHNPFNGFISASLLCSVVNASLWDVAYELIAEYPKLARKKNGDSIPLKAIAKKLDAYYSHTKYNCYQTIVYSHVPVEISDLFRGHEIQDIENQETNKGNFVPNNQRSCFHRAIEWIYFKFWEVVLRHVSHIEKLKKEKEMHNKALAVLKCICTEVGEIKSFREIRGHYLEAITLAVENNNREVVKEIIESFPQAISTRVKNYPLIQLAIKNRSERVYNYLVHEEITDKHVHKACTDEYGNNILHLAGQLAPIYKLNRVSGAALQMQRELQWFEEVKTFAYPEHKYTMNNIDELPIMVFRREHKKLRKEGETWMKETANSYTITAALIITIVFAAAITVPGGNDGSTGKALYASKRSFIVFAIADAISLFTSTTSLLFNLSILTARYREEDFLYKLPRRLILGLATLFLSITSMMVAFGATLYLMFGEGKEWIVIPISTLAFLPIASFVKLQLQLIVDLISSTYGRGIFIKKK